MSSQEDIFPAPSSRRGLSALVEAMRPIHWVKNVFVLAPVVFAHKFDDLDSWIRCLWAAAVFCLLASGVYLLNDLVDRQGDQQHPVKRHRPVASGRLSVSTALLAGLVFLSAGLLMAAGAKWFWPGSMGGLGLLAWACAYVLITLLYSYWLKKHPIVDVIVVSLGFVLRAMAGAAAIDVPVSPWLVVCTFTLCLFIALTKRRSEVAFLDETASAARGANAGYDMADLNVMISVASAMAIITYALYCLSPHTIERTVRSANMVWTIPLVVYGVFRFNRLTSLSGRDPIYVLARDRAMQAVLVLYIIATLLIIQFGGSEFFRDILEVYPGGPTSK